MESFFICFLVTRSPTSNCQAQTNFPTFAKSQALGKECERILSAERSVASRSLLRVTNGKRKRRVLLFRRGARLFCIRLERFILYLFFLL